MNQQSIINSIDQKRAPINNFLISSGSHAPWFAPPPSCNGASAASLAAATSNAGSAPAPVHAGPRPKPPWFHPTTTAAAGTAAAAKHHHGGEQPEHGDSAAHASTAAPAAEPTHAHDARTASGVFATASKPANDLHLSTSTHHASPTPTSGAAPPTPNASRATTTHATTATATNLQLSGKCLHLIFLSKFLYFYQTGAN
jgi:hypothetical protein